MISSTGMSYRSGLSRNAMNKLLDFERNIELYPSDETFQIIRWARSCPVELRLICFGFLAVSFARDAEFYVLSALAA